MTLVREYQPTFVLGDGETKEFSYLFEEVSENFVKVVVKHSDDSTYVPVFSVDLDAHKVVFGESETAPLDTDLVCIYRETPDLQDTPFRTLQGYDAKALENILSKIVAMIQELKANGFSTQILQGTPWQLDLLHPADDGASVVVDYNARILKKGLYFQLVSGNLQVSADGNSFISMPKSADITEFRRLETVLEDLTVQYRLQYKVDGVWYNAESNAEATADEALQVAQDAKDIAQAASDKVDAFDDRLTIAEGDASDAKQDASDAKELAEDTAETVESFDDRLTQAEQDSSDAKSIAQTTSGNLTTHTSNTNNPHQVTKAQIGLGNVDNTSDLDKPVSTATQNAITPLQQQINHLQTIGRFLSFWDATTGLAQTNPQTSPYIYQTGDYFRVGVVASGGATNYRPTGSSYTIGVASTVVETNPLTKGQVYYYDGTNWGLASGGTVAIDGTTIVFNSDNEIQAVATANQNTTTGATNPVYNWVGTLVQYNAQNIATLHPDWICYITDDFSSQAYDAYSKTQSDARYVQKAHEVVEFQVPTAQNNYTWYRKYADGWVEQGGQCSISQDTTTTVTMPIAMSNTGYTVMITPASSIRTGGDGNFTVTRNSVTQFGWCNGDDFSGTGLWVVYGMAA